MYVFMTAQAELERLQQSDARNRTAIQSLRQQLAEVDEGRGEGRGEGAGLRGLPELHTEIGRLKTALKEKVRNVISALKSVCESPLFM